VIDEPPHASFEDAIIAYRAYDQQILFANRQSNGM
jgi:hypothetical protein